MAVISLLKRKGGSGSSTIAAHLGVEFANRAGSAAILDADPQQSLVRWAQGSEEGLLHRMVQRAANLEDSEFRALLEKAKAEHPWVIIDCAPGLDGSALTAAHLADVILIPCRPSVLDTDLAGDAMRAAVMVKQDGGRIAFVPSANLPHTKVGRALAGDLEAVGATQGATVMPGITHRIKLAEAPLNGTTLQESEPSGDGAKEFAALADAVEALL
jgi:chromosome partitioning protein